MARNRNFGIPARLNSREQTTLSEALIRLEIVRKCLGFPRFRQLVVTLAVLYDYVPRLYVPRKLTSDVWKQLANPLPSMFVRE
ncbi:hypothetical protein APICC_05078 [Apis cerana cerana]|uniref:Uncharacterized protein n=1 Tax=Apis cerana cerana TaxID=94128 RepID=A0A2A3E1C7_APICC|nr:hypothetical protein APICC_05078 [Apis cerana cerana]